MVSIIKTVGKFKMVISSRDIGIVFENSDRDIRRFYFPLSLNDYQDLKYLVRSMLNEVEKVIKEVSKNDVSNCEQLTIFNEEQKENE